MGPVRPRHGEDDARRAHASQAYPAKQVAVRRGADGERRRRNPSARFCLPWVTRMPGIPKCARYAASDGSSPARRFPTDERWAPRHRLDRYRGSGGHFCSRGRDGAAAYRYTEQSFALGLCSPRSAKARSSLKNTTASRRTATAPRAGFVMNGSFGIRWGFHAHPSHNLKESPRRGAGDPHRSEARRTWRSFPAGFPRRRQVSRAARFARLPDRRARSRCARDGRRAAGARPVAHRDHDSTASSCRGARRDRGARKTRAGSGRKEVSQDRSASSSSSSTWWRGASESTASRSCACDRARARAGCGQ